MKQLIVASTLYQCLCLAAAVDEAKLPPVEAPGADSDAVGERILVLAGSAPVPELGDALQNTPGFPALARRFDRVVDYGELLWPHRPGQFSPRDDELLMWEKLLRSYWKLGNEPVQLVLESIQVDPAIALARIFSSASVVVHSDGLMSYGPTRNPLPRHIAQRLDALLYVDLIPGLDPVLLREHRPERMIVSRAAVRTVIDELALGSENGVLVDRRSPAKRTALVLGQYLTRLRILTLEEEDEQQRLMLIEAAARGAEVCVFKPHPSAGPARLRELEATAEELGLELLVLRTAALAEVVIAQLQPDVVIGSFSTALATARYLFDIETVAVGTDLLLERLSPYQNSNRIPATIIDALMVRPALPSSTASERVAELQRLVDTVAYCMQPTTLTALRPQAVQFLDTAVHTDQLRYFKRRRLTTLDLPGSLPMQRRLSVVARIPGHVRRVRRRVIAALAS